MRCFGAKTSNGQVGSCFWIHTLGNYIGQCGRGLGLISTGHAWACCVLSRGLKFEKSCCLQSLKLRVQSRVCDNFGQKSLDHLFLFLFIFIFISFVSLDPIAWY